MQRIQSPVMERTRLGYLAAPVTKSGDITTIVLTISRNTCDRLSQDVLRPSGLTSISNYCPPYVAREVKIYWRVMEKENPRGELQKQFYNGNIKHVDTLENNFIVVQADLFFFDTM